MQYVIKYTDYDEYKYIFFRKNVPYRTNNIDTAKKYDTRNDAMFDIRKYDIPYSKPVPVN